MLEQHGLVPLRSLEWAQLLHKAGIQYARLPAYPRGRYRAEHLWRDLDGGGYPADAFDDDLHADLGDRLFTFSWVRSLVESRVLAGSDKPAVLRGIAERGPEFQKALQTVDMIGGRDALNEMLVIEGLWLPVERARRKG